MHKRALLQVTHACPALHRTRLRLRVQSASTQAQPLKPLVVCIGWLGAKRRYLDKYVELWERRGHDTLALRPRTSSVVIPPLGDRQAADALSAVAAAQDAQPGRRTVYHVFSNAGFLFFGTMLRSLATGAPAGSATRRAVFSDTAEHGGAPAGGSAAGAGELLHDARRGGPLSVLSPVTGLILDSTPSRLTPDIAARRAPRGFVSAALAEPAEGIEDARPRLVGAARRALRPILESRYIARRTAEVWRAWQTLAPRAKQLYLYSDADALIPPSEVRRCMALQEARGVDVSARMFRGSPHVAHFRQYPGEYEAELDRFLHVPEQAAPAA